MIFVTVGTHEQPFDRLIEAVDRLKLNGKIMDSVFIQTGYATYTPRSCQYKKFISMDQMNEYMQKANVVITHGGPSSFVLALQYNKIPIVVPRLSKYNEHVNDHQLTFCRELVARKFPIRVLEDVKDLEHEINDIETTNFKETIELNNKKFVKKLTVIADELI